MTATEAFGTPLVQFDAILQLVLVVPFQLVVWAVDGKYMQKSRPKNTKHCFIGGIDGYLKLDQPYKRSSNRKIIAYTINSTDFCCNHGELWMK